MKLSKSATRKLLSAFLILSLGACASAPPKSTRFDGNWQFCENVPQKPLACLEQPDVEKLRELLIRCEAPK